ncbi:DEDD exonuclease domain-containing protein [Cellulomonas sp. URHE0023]|uniref:DEDD exonuclease domain-containing protein n=1 Tax=Cellulomonas sp. URHE0023 TaxID=1380354 RepID=UPI0009DDE9AA|nr:DEDD exonuclease domain-containing protein [Cellulomonas sp. URHE0023]
MSSARRLRPVWADATPEPGATPHQPTLDDLGTPLSDVTFVVVDLETTGGTPADCAITEIGAVKVRGGEVLGEFQTLVDPGGPVPPFIQVLTGITTTMLIGAPPIEEVLPSFLEFSRGTVLVAHNAPFDIGFLKAAAARTGHAWPGNKVLDTVRLARRVVTRDEVPNHKLSSLAALFHATVTPNHRALADAQATVDVLHALLGRLAPLGITHLEDLATATDPVPEDVRRKRTLADGLPDGPGVYLFRGPGDEVLYVGTSTTSLRKRVRSYFTSAEKRGRMIEMVRIAHRVDPISCATPLEARVRELRLIAAHSPRYNRRSRFPERMPWVRLTAEPYPRLSVVREVKAGDGATYIGPFASATTAQLALEALHETFPIRQCTRRLPVVAPAGASACVLAEMGRCSAPCVGDAPEYAGVVEAVRHAMLDNADPVVGAHAHRIDALVDQERFEEAATVRDRLGAFLRGAARAQRFAPLAACSELVAARRTDDGGWELVLVRFGRLAGTARVDRRTDPRPAIATLQASGEHVDAAVAPAPAAHPEETDLVITWLDQPGVRLVEVSSTWAHPVRSAQRLRDPAAAVATALRPVEPFEVHPVEARGERPPVVLTGALDDADARVLPTTSVRQPRTA